jgi:predicted permease
MIPLSGDDNLGGVYFEGRPDPPPGEEVIALYYRVSENYFTSMGIPLKSGRSFSSSDGPETAPVVVISENLARDHYSDEEPIGQRIRLSGTWCEIIGVAGEVQHYTLGGSNDPPQVYIFYRQNPRTSLTYVLHTAVSPLSLAQAVRGEVLAVDSEQPVQSIETIEQMVEGSISVPRFRTLLLTCFAATALLLAAIGLYGIMSFAVSQRIHEIGVRMALGAQPGAVLGLILRGGLALVAIGMGVGLAGALALTDLLESLLFGIGIHDTAVFTLVPVLLIVTALVAMLVPARRATRVDPVRALVRE